MSASSSTMAVIMLPGIVRRADGQLAFGLA
jgi:hypothetical protein